VSATTARAEPVLVRLRAPGELDVPAPDDAPRRFHASMPGYETTPLRGAEEAARRLGVGEVLVKDESSRLGMPSFKVLGASWAVHRALVQRLGASVAEVPTFRDLAQAVKVLGPLTLSAATDGNHGHAVARIAAMLGLRAQVYVPRGTASARIEAIAAEGASVSVVDGGYNDAVRRSAEDAGERCLVISDTSWDGYVEIPRWVVDGYSTIFHEVEDQLGERRPDVVVIPIGVGALAAAAVRHFWSTPGPRSRLVGVEPTCAACILESVAAGSRVTLGHPQDSIMAGLNCDTPSLVAWPLVSRGIDVYLSVDDARVPKAMRLLARDGVVAGESGAAALAGLLRVVDAGGEQLRAALELGPRTRVLLLCTEGATDPVSYRQLIGESDVGGR
jgi:diaminopropionate ammonia-lyase